MDDAKDDQETDLAETPEQGNQSSGAFPPPIANIKVLFPFKASDIYETSVVNKKKLIQFPFSIEFYWHR